MAHCKICARKVIVRKDSLDHLWQEPEGSHTDQAEYQRAPKSVVAAPGFLKSFNQIWELLLKNVKNSTPQRFSIPLETFMVEGERDAVLFTENELPTLCQRCCGKIVSVENLMKAVRHQFWEIEMLWKESRRKRNEETLTQVEGVDNISIQGDNEGQSKDIPVKPEGVESMGNQKDGPSSLLCSEALDSPTPMDWEVYNKSGESSSVSRGDEDDDHLNLQDEGTFSIKSEDDEEEMPESPVPLETPNIPIAGPDPLSNIAPSQAPLQPVLLPLGGTLTPVTFVCTFPGCNEKFMNYIRFSIHQQLCHSPAAAPVPGPSTPPIQTSSNFRPVILRGRPRKQIHPEDTKTKFPCTCGCGTVFNSKRNYSRHLQMLRENPNEEKKLRQKRHALELIRNGKGQRCDMCYKPVLYTDILQHFIGHVGSDEHAVKCPNDECPQTFLTSIGLQGHLGSSQCCGKIGKEKKTGMVCDTCGFTADNRLTLKNHVESVHELVGGEKKFQCPLSSENCRKMFNVKQSIYFHLSTHRKKEITKQNCDQCRESYKLEEIEGHLKDKHGVKMVFGCKQCPFKFSGRNELLEHLYEHRHVGMFCDVCDSDNQVKFTNYVDFREHYVLVHNLCPKKYKCDKCGIGFWTISRKNNHEFMQHSADGMSKKEDKKEKDKGKFVCDECLDVNVAFRSQLDLISHKIKLHGMEPFKCDICENTFSEKAKLTRHMKEHAGAVVRKEWKCDVEGCDAKPFAAKKNWKRHMEIHHGDGKKHMCDTCGKSYGDKISLRSHIDRVHLKLKQCICEECGEAFSGVEVLKKHKLIHTGERPFECQICGQRFRHKEVRRRHLIGHKVKGADFKPNGPMKQLRKRKAQ